MAGHRDDVATVLFGRVTLGVFALLGVVVALAEWGVVPGKVLIIGAPALAAALLLDTVLYNEFLLSTGAWIWVEIYAFLYAEAVVVGAVVHLLEPYWLEYVAAGG